MDRHTLSRIKLPIKIRGSYLWGREARAILPSKPVGFRTKLFSPCWCSATLTTRWQQLSLADLERRVGESQGAACFKKTRPKQACYITSNGSSQFSLDFSLLQATMQENSWFLRISMLTICAEISLYLPRIGPGVSAAWRLGVQAFLLQGLVSPSPPAPCPILSHA